jgi:hypothetical protein
MKEQRKKKLITVAILVAMALSFYLGSFMFLTE